MSEARGGGRGPATNPHRYRSRIAIDEVGAGHGAAPVAAGRAGSFDQADQEPGYSAAGTPIAASAATWCAAVTPEPQ